MFARLFVVHLLAVLLLAACSGCQKDEDPPFTDTPPAADLPRRGGKVVIGSPAAPASVNELSGKSSSITTEVIRLLFLKLVTERPDFKNHPPSFDTDQLAEDYTISPDRKAVTFTLRSDVFWSDGRPVTAHDVRFTWEAQRHTNWPSAYMKERITDVEVIDPQLVRFHFDQGYVKQLLDINEGVILPMHAWGRLPFEEWQDNPDWFFANLVVSGPFTVKSWGPLEVVLARNARYFRKDLPYLDEVHIQVGQHDELRTKFFEGKIDFMSQIDPTDVARVRTSPSLRMVDPFWHRLYVCVIWNHRQHKFASAEVRKALTMAINRQKIVDDLFPGGTGRVAISPILQDVWAFKDGLEPIVHDPEEAVRILENHGWKDTDGDEILDKDGEAFSFNLLVGDNSLRRAAALMIQEDLKKVGIQAVLQHQPHKTLVDSGRAGTFDAMIFGFTIDTSLDMSSLFGSQATEDANFGAYSNGEFDRLMTEAMSRPTLQDAEDLLHDLQQIIHDDQPVTFLWESQRLSAHNVRLQNARPNALFSLYNLQEWWVNDLPR